MCFSIALVSHKHSIQIVDAPSQTDREHIVCIVMFCIYLFVDLCSFWKLMTNFQLPFWTSMKIGITVKVTSTIIETAVTVGEWQSS